MIAVDAMGGDFAPTVAVHGAYRAACKGIEILLFGQEQYLESLLDQLDPHWNKLPITLIHCGQVVMMDDEPVKSIMQKNDSSLVRALESVAERKAKAIVTAGNSGASLVGGMLTLGKIPGISRAAIGDFLPTETGSVFCVDLGANIDCKPEYLRQFAIIGHEYVQLTKNISSPRIGLLSNGAEAYKGSATTKQVYELLEQSGLHFIGNIEPKEMFKGKVDVVVCDGFTGNIMLKAIEGTAETITRWIKNEYARSLFLKTLGLLHIPMLRRLKKRVDYTQKGGALLLGVNYPLIIAHGCSDARAIENAIIFAHQIVNDNIVPQLNANLIKWFDKEASLITEPSLVSIDTVKQVSDT